MITADGKNKSNIETRFNRTQGIIRQINTTASSEIMSNIETKTILQLYETCIVDFRSNQHACNEIRGRT